MTPARTPWRHPMMPWPVPCGVQRADGDSTLGLGGARSQADGETAVVDFVEDFSWMHADPPVGGDTALPRFQDRSRGAAHPSALGSRRHRCPGSRARPRGCRPEAGLWSPSGLVEPRSDNAGGILIAGSATRVGATPDVPMEDRGGDRPSRGSREVASSSQAGERTGERRPPPCSFLLAALGSEK